MIVRIPIKGECSMRTRIFGLILLSVTSLAAAKPNVPTGFYLGAGIGKARVTLEDPNPAYDFKGTATSTRVLAGYRFLPWVAVEGAYTDFGKAEDTVVGQRLRSDFDAWSLGPVGMLPLGPVDLKAKLGLSRWKGSLRNVRTGYRSSFSH